MSFPSPSPTQARVIWMALTGLAIALIVALVAASVWGLGRVLHFLAPVVWPVAIAGILAYLLDPVVDFLTRRGEPRGRAIVMVFVLFSMALGLVTASFAPRLISETGDLISRLPAYAVQVQKSVVRWYEQLPPAIKKRLRPAFGSVMAISGTNAPAASPMPVGAPAAIEPAVKSDEAATDQLIEKLIAWSSRAIPAVSAWLFNRLTQVASWVSTILGLAMVPVFSYYFLQEKQHIQEGWTRYLPVTESRFKQELVFCLKAINDYLIVFFRGQVVIAMIDGVLFCIGFAAIGLNYSLLIGFLAGALSIVPYLGTILTIVPATILAAVQFQDWLHPLLVLGVFTLVQSAEGFYISPKIMGDRVGLHPLTIIIAVLVGTTLLGGILGGILAIPLTAALRVIMFRYVWKQPETLGDDDD